MGAVIAGPPDVEPPAHPTTTPAGPDCTGATFQDGLTKTDAPSGIGPAASGESDDAATATRGLGRGCRLASPAAWWPAAGPALGHPPQDPLPRLSGFQ